MRRSRAALAVGAVASAVSAALAVPAAPADGSALYREGSTVARPRGATGSLRAGPGSERVLAVAKRTTDFGSPTTFAVAGVTGRWVEVISPQLPNGVRGFVNRKLLTLSHVRVAIDVDLSQRELRVWRAGEIRRRIEVAIGAPASPTPIGRFA